LSVFESDQKTLFDQPDYGQILFFEMIFFCLSLQNRERAEKTKGNSTVESKKTHRKERQFNQYITPSSPSSSPSPERASAEGEKKSTENERGTKKSRTGERRYREGESQTQREREKEETVSTREVLFRRCHSQASIFSKH
jgi:hypothetical protein